MSTNLLRLPEVMARTGISRSVIYARVQTGDFPSPVKLGSRTVAWPENEIDDWIIDRIRESRDTAGDDE